MICPVCGSSRIYRVRFDRTAEGVICRCPDCEHSFDREEVRDFNENRDDDDE